MTGPWPSESSSQQRAGAADGMQGDGVGASGPRSQRRVAVVATLTARPDPDGGDLRRLPPAVSHLEIRADLIGDLDPGPLRRHFAGQLIYSLRSRWHGGECADPPGLRRERLAQAAHGYDLVDLEADHDLVPDLLSHVPADRRRISWHGGPLAPALLRAQFNWVSAVPARLYLIAPAVTSAEQALPPLQLLAQLRRPDVTAFGTGPAGAWSRLLAPWLGAPVTFGRLTPANGIGVPTIDQLLTDYPFPDLPQLRKVYGVVGRGVATSLSPHLHNAAYRRRELPSLFLPFYVPTRAEFLTGFWPTLAEGLDGLGLPLSGLTVTAPLKEVGLAMADSAGPTARAAGSANALIRRDGRWRAESTDASGTAVLLRQAAVAVDGRKVAVIGCGGAGRAAATVLLARGAQVTLVNRSQHRGQLAADLLEVPFAALADFDPAGLAVVVHATPVCAELPFDVARLDGDTVVMDLVYGPGETALTAAARRRGLRTIDGWQVLSTEVAHQFQLMTGRTMPAPARAEPAPGMAGVPDALPLGPAATAAAGNTPKE